ncbi:MAG: Wadjet anti-phage system protein JetD domain-containing protein, partial [Acidimicrobiales bacterium]
EAEAGALHRMAVVTHSRRPEALAVLCRRPVALLAHVEVWERLLDLVDWIEAHPAPAVYLRQIELPGVDTKLIESHRPVLAELFDVAVPEAIVSDEATGVRGFERRYGFQSKPNLVRFRILDPERQLPGLAYRPTTGEGAERTDRPHLVDVTVDAATFARLDLGNELGLERVFLVENEINFLAFPERKAAMVVLVAGYGTERLAAARWLDGLSLHYWGDLDTHGFAILDELRRRFPEVESFLMDRQSLLDHNDLWVDEPRQERRDLPRLTTTEARLYDDLRWNRLGERVRLEQERISFGRLLTTLDSMGSPTTAGSRHSSEGEMPLLQSRATGGAGSAAAEVRRGRR